MKTLTAILICSGTVVGVVWLALLVCAVSDKLRGYKVPDFPEEEPEFEATPVAPMPWWRYVLSAPLYVLFVPLAFFLGIIFLPMMLVEFLWAFGARVRARLSGRVSEQAR